LSPCRRDDTTSAATYTRSLAVTLNVAATAPSGKLPRSHRLPTAVCAFSDYCALGVIGAKARASGAQRLLVTGYDNSLVAELATINLTSVSQEPPVLAQSAVRTAIDRLEGRAAAPTDTIPETPSRLLLARRFLTAAVERAAGGSGGVDGLRLVLGGL
jgi:hypothetical protein